MKAGPSGSIWVVSEETLTSERISLQSLIFRAHARHGRFEELHVPDHSSTVHLGAAGDVIQPILHVPREFGENPERQ